MKTRLLALAIAGALAFVACGGSADQGEMTEGQDVVVDMFDNRYQFTEIRIPVGGSVTWVGAGRNPHNAVDAGDEWSTEEDFGGLEQLEGDEAKLTFDSAGTYTFYCTFHGNAQGDGMAGTLIVGEG